MQSDHSGPPLLSCCRVLFATCFGWAPYLGTFCPSIVSRRVLDEADFKAHVHRGLGMLTEVSECLPRRARVLTSAHQIELEDPTTIC